MDLFVLHSLLLDIALDHFFIRILTHCVHVETTRPEVATPQNLLHFWVVLEDVLRSETFDNLDNFGRREDGDTLDEKMDVILICSDLDEAKFVPLLNV